MALSTSLSSIMDSCRARLFSRQIGTILFPIALLLLVAAFTAWRMEICLDCLDFQKWYSKRVSSSATLDGLSLDKRDYITGRAPANSFRDNLKADVRYVTTWHYAGMTNDFIVLCNLIYLGILSQRVPILPPLAPAGQHVGAAAAIDFGEIFDLPALSKAVQWPILEWSDVKRAKYNESVVYGDTILTDVERDELGCWSTWAATSEDHRPAHSVMTELLALDIVYTAVPRSAKLIKAEDRHVRFSSLASILMPQGRADALNGTEALSTATFEERMEDVVLEPDDQLACFDLLYFASAKTPWEWTSAGAPAWSLVGTHARFTSRVESMAEEYLRDLFRLGDKAVMPKFITVHIRRTDFRESCATGLKPEECFPLLSAYERRIDQVRSIIEEARSERVVDVIVTSDESDPSWWADVRALGWKHIDHAAQETVRKYGLWYPSIIDAAIQARGAGFVGTASSTMSIVAEKRVRDWGNGPSKHVRKPNADP